MVQAEEEEEAVTLMVLRFVKTLVGMKWRRARSEPVTQPCQNFFFFFVLFGVLVSFWLSSSVCLDTVFLQEEAAISFLCVCFFFSCSALTLQTLLSFCSAPEPVCFFFFFLINFSTQELASTAVIVPERMAVVTFCRGEDVLALPRGRGVIQAGPSRRRVKTKYNFLVSLLLGVK